MTCIIYIAIKPNCRHVVSCVLFITSTLRGRNAPVVFAVVKPIYIELITVRNTSQIPIETFRETHIK